MDDFNFTVKAIAAIMGVNIKELSELAGIPYNHLKEVSAGRVKLTLEDGKKLSDASGVPINQIVNN